MWTLAFISTAPRGAGGIAVLLVLAWVFIDVRWLKATCGILLAIWLLWSVAMTFIVKHSGYLIYVALALAMWAVFSEIKKIVMSNE